MIENEIKTILDHKNPKLREEVKVFDPFSFVQQRYVDGRICIVRDGYTNIFVFTKGIVSIEVDITDDDYANLISAYWSNNRHDSILDANARVRRADTASETSRYFTFKTDLNGIIIEIERKIPTWKFDKLWKNGKLNISKHRYKYTDAYNILWDTDFLLDDDYNTYFSLSEAEMPVEYEEPPETIPLVQKFSIYKVNRKDKRFTNKKLSDVQYATNLYEHIKNGTIDIKL